MPSSNQAAPSSDSLHYVVVREVPIELCQFMKFGGLTESGGEAKLLISQGHVLVNGAVETRKRKKLDAGDRVEFHGKTIVVQLP